MFFTEPFLLTSKSLRDSSDSSCVISVIGGPTDVSFSGFVVGVSGGVVKFGHSVLRYFGRFNSIIRVNLRVLKRLGHVGRGV